MVRKAGASGRKEEERRTDSRFWERDFWQRSLKLGS